MRSVALDTNLFVLLCVGTASLSFIESHKKTSAYSVADFEKLKRIVGGFSRLVSTPYSLAEASNHLNIAERRPLNRPFAKSFAFYTNLLEEVQVSARICAERSEFVKLGLTDTAWIEHIDNETLLLSADAGFVSYARACKLNAEWFQPSRQKR
jgi:hypothetical protein